MAGINSEYLSDHKLFRIRNKKLLLVFPLIAVLVTIIVFWWLKITGITVTGDAFCGADEHTHTEDCYNYVLICGYDDTTTTETTTIKETMTEVESTTAEVTTAGNETTSAEETTAESESTTVQETAAETTTQAKHIHTDACYRKELICTIPEHRHSAECFPDNNADVETQSDWLASFESVEITNDVAKNLLSIASTQVGYKESVLNYDYDDLSEKNGYTRYGEWYGSPYGKWNATFVSFCINYANINNCEKLISASAEVMRAGWESKKLYTADKAYAALPGDVVFFDNDSNGQADRTGIVVCKTDSKLIVIEGDVDGAVAEVVYDNTDKVMGYGMTGGLYEAEHITQTQEAPETEAPTQIEGELNNYIPNATDPSEQDYALNENTVDSGALILMSNNDHDITYTSHLEGEIVNAVLKETSGTVIGPGSTVYVGETYIVSLEFSEINTGSSWVQFKPDSDGYLTYHIPSNLQCEPFDKWHTISAKTEDGTIQDVGEYFIDENGLLKVKFYEDDDGVNFVDKYSNVDFTVEFNTTVASTQSGTSTDIEFSDEIKVNVNIDGGAAMSVIKTHGEYDEDTNTMDYTIMVEATHGVVKDLIIDDQIWENHYTLRDTIVVTDLEGNVLDPQPTISDHPSHNAGANEGFRLTGFPDFAAGDGFLIKYKTSLYNEVLGNEKVDMWNGIDAYGKDSNSNDIYVWADDWLQVELDKMKKEGKQAVVYDAAGNAIPAIEWEIEIRKTAYNLYGTVVVDTLGNGLEYYTGQPMLIKRYDEWGNRLPDAYIDWNTVTITGNTMSFPLPDGFSYTITYYTTYEELAEGEMKNYTNSAKVTINGKEEHTNGSADVVGFIPNVRKSASGNDGEYVYFTIEADVPGVIKDWGGFFLTDLAAFWGYKENAEGFLYVQNIPQDVTITATTESGKVVTFTPYRQGGPTENTYILVSPSLENGEHSFNILFNTADKTTDSSKWILAEDSTLKITYKIPFDSKTGTEWSGELKGDLTMEDVLLQDYKLANEAYLNYTNIIQGTGSSTYEYSPMITKKSFVHDSGVIDYTVTFNNTIPGSGGSDGYINATTDPCYFTDTFDEKLEYVQGSLIVTCYSPWQKNLWLAKYKYNGAVNGNSFNVSSNNFEFFDYNEEASTYGWNSLAGAATLTDYINWVNAGGQYIFTYSLKLKDEYLSTTEHSKFLLDNTAELTWGNDNTSGPVTEESEYETGLLEKNVVQEDSKLLFDIHINRSALDILPGSDTLTIEDTMTHNLSVYWDSIKLMYEEGEGNWIDFNSPGSKYTYTVTYDPALNKLTFVVPDSLHIRVDYTTLITESGMVSVNNAVKIDGKAQISDVIDALFRVEEHSGGASGSNNKITLLKQNGLTNARLPGATFVLYGLVGDPNATVPNGVAPTIVADDGRILKYIGIYTTGDDGTVEIETQYLTIGGPYALVEHVAPEGYDLLTAPVYFYFYDTDPNGVIQTVTTIIAVENYQGGFLIPETGNTELFTTAIIGFVFIALPVLYSLIRYKRKRRLQK